MNKLAIALAALLSAPAVFAQRLPTNVVPEHYTLRFEPDLTSESFTGEATIRVQLKQRVRTIELHAITLTLRDVTVGDAHASVRPESDKEMVLLELEHPVGPGPASIHAAFEGTLRQQLRGFYLSTTRSRNYAVTQFEATDARRAFPCFDEPAMKATFDITIVAPKGDTAISNMPVASDRVLADGRHELRFATTPKLPAYLVAMLVGDFQCTSGGSERLPIRVCATPERAGLTQYAVSAAADEIRFYEKYYGIRFPFPKLDNVGIPDFQAGAMENAGAITYRETALLAGGTTTTERRRQIAGTVGHEVAHQWFGDLVTMKWWNDVWLNEGFATFMTPKAIAAVYPQWETAAETAQSARRSISADSVRATRAIRTPVDGAAEINELFDAIAYGKTAAVLRMVEHWVGEEPFRRGIHDYLTKYSWSNAAGEDFWNTMSATTGRPVDRVMKSFVFTPGVPVVAAKQSCANGMRTVELRQERFLVSPGEAPPAAWEMPVCVRAGSEQCVVMSKPVQTLTMKGCDAPLMLNVAGAGYYIAQYAPSDLRALRLASLSVPERVTLLGDDWLLVRGRRRDVRDDLALVSALPATISRTELDMLRDRFRTIDQYLVTDANRAAWQQWVAAATRRWLPAGGWCLSGCAGESEEQREKRAAALELFSFSGDPETLAGARELALRALDDPKAVDPTLAEVALDVTAHHGDAALYDRVLAAMGKATTPDERIRLALTLFDFRDPALIERSIRYATSSEVRTQDVPQSIGSLLSNPAARPVMWQWLRTNWDEVSKRLPYWALQGAIGEIRTACDPETQKEVEEFFRTHRAPGAERRVRAALEQIETCTAFRQTQAPALGELLAGK
jgi:aminopeptidase N